MTGRFRGADSIGKLLKIARAEAETVRLDLADVDRARASTEAEIENITAAVAREEAGATDAAAFAAFAEAMRERRFNLNKTLNALDGAGEAAREKLTAALAEIAKLERLADINARDALAARRRREARLEADGAAPHAAAKRALADRAGAQKTIAR